MEQLSKQTDSNGSSIALINYFALISEGCHFSGHLEKDSEACVGMTGCIGSEDVEFTILSDHATCSGLYKWSKDGNVELMPHPFEVLLFLFIINSVICNTIAK